MRKFVPLLSMTVVSMCVTLAWAAADVTVTGEGQCAKCSLKVTKGCQNAIVAEEDGKKVTYFLAKNKVANDFHKNICQDVKKITATGTVEEKDGKKVLTAKEIKVAE